MIKLITGILILAGCKTIEPSAPMPLTKPGDTIWVKKVMINQYAVRVDYIINLGEGYYSVNGEKLKLIGYDSTNKKNFKPSKVSKK